MAEISFKILIGDFVKLFFKSGLSAQGTVVEWFDDKLCLKAENCEDLLWINNPKEDLLMVRVFAPKNSTELTQEKPTEKQVLPVASEFQPEQNLDIKQRGLKLADLKVKQAEQERKNTAQKLKSFEPSTNVQQVKYGQPKFVKQHSSEKITSGSNANIARMRKVQRENQIKRGLRKM